MSGDHKPGNVKVGKILFTIRVFHKRTKLALVPTLFCHIFAVLFAPHMILVTVNLDVSGC